ncbi:membrane protein insertase YidC [Candidatus Woesebacteria bacterium]|jgi:YidC/Oxa1 family membrane protein insertase|nr:membrane protein insertase YidC [Candidatus Woesebacteria bacterium]
MLDANIWNQLFMWPIINLLMAFYKIFEWAHIPGPLGFAVIALTIAIRFLLYPLMHAQLSSAKKMQNLKPHLDALTAKHKDNKTALQQAQLDLYKEHGVNPAAGCLPLLIQMPVLIALYNVFYQVLQNGNMAKLVSDLNHVAYASWLHITMLDLSFLGTNLAVKPSQWQTHGWWLLLIPVITGLLQFWQSKLMMPAQVAPDAKLAIKKKGAVEEKKPEDTAMEMQKQMMLITPIMFGMFAYQFPLGLALYWNIFGVFGIMQQLKVNKLN